MVVHNPNNWHWVDKNCIDWAKRYFAEKLVKLSTGSPSDPLFVQVGKVNSVEGDCEVNQRKGKVISLFDLKIALSIEGHIEDGTTFEGSIIIPEVAFDTDVNDYQFDISVYKETNKMADVKPLVRGKLVPQLRDVFSGFGDELLYAHGNDIQVPEDQVKSTYTKANQASSLQGIAGGGAPRPAAGTKPAAAAPAPATKSAPLGPSEKLSVATVSNTTSIHLEPTFNVSAVDLYRTYIDKQRIAAWTRSPPRFDNSDSQAVIGPGSVVHLFGGNVTMTLVEAVDSSRLVFHWRLSSWSPAQISTLVMDFHESHEYHETKLVVSWSGIPIGDEDKVRDNFNEFYVRSVKITFGFGSVL